MAADSTIDDTVEPPTVRPMTLRSRILAAVILVKTDKILGKTSPAWAIELAKKADDPNF